jgi:hypothetical protein
MNPLIESLPGVSMSVEEVTQTLRHMWDQESDVDDHRMDFRASQMNLIVHFGLETSVEEAHAEFSTAINFAQKYPCRIVILCPGGQPTGEVEFEGKLFSQCYIGSHLRELCCCEALILGYSPEQSDFLESQVSIWLESDLPIYHWLHRVPAERIEQHYLGFMKRCKKVLYDGAICGDTYDNIDWPDSVRTSDLAHARTLPLRQHIGQFLSGFPPAELVDGLESLNISYSRSMRRMAYQLLKWQQGALSNCYKKNADFDSVVTRFEPIDESDQDCCLRIEWNYKAADRYLKIEYSRSHKSGLIRASLPSGKFEHPLHIEPLGPEAALGEAMFFG